MGSLATVLVALGLSADAFAVSISSGLRIKYIKLNKALKIALFFGCFQAFMPIIGWWGGMIFKDILSAVDHWFAFGILSVLGMKMIYESSQNESTEKRFNPLDTYTLITLSVGTSIDALAVGMGFGLLKTSIMPTVTAIGFMTFFLSFIGVFIGHKFGNLFQNKVEIVGGAILIIIGSKILIEHLSAIPN